MRVDQFDFELPEELIAVEPIEPRDASRLLHVSPLVDPKISDREFRSLLDIVHDGDVLVFNDTKVIPAHISGYRVRGENRASMTLNLNRPLPNGHWSVFAKPAKKLDKGDSLEFAEGVTGLVVEKKSRGEIIIAFNADHASLFDIFEKIGKTPLPPYISARRQADNTDIARYQTVYADKPGAVAAPTAGLHFTTELLAALKQKGVIFVNVTLHVGGGTFLPVSVEDTDDHIMHSEFAMLDEEAAIAINNAKRNGKRIIATGTTALRVLETASKNGIASPFQGDTNIFIQPGYKFQMVDALITNFHLPRSTLFMLVSAFCGTELMKQAYMHAIAQKYRFYSYGDACFLER